MRVTWDDLNRIDAPGEYRLGDRRLKVEQSEIATWRANPKATCLVIGPYTMGDQEIYNLCRGEFPDP